MDKMKMAMKLKELRGNKTQAEVAKAIGISTSAYAMYETGNRIPRDDKKVLIADYFGVSINVIFYA